MQTPSKQEPGVTGLGALRFVKEAPNVNGGGFSNGQGSFTLSMGGEGAGQKRSAADAGFGESDSDSDTSDQLHGGFPGPGGPGMPGPKPGKKTKGRVKIKMEFIENKLRRYTTFSKRKTGIMKKAYELSTLTGTQVMLLVASETGHVYTFATRKLQPMITSESGKALIQTCLNSPDPPPVGPGQQIDQRMNPSGFEETELSYAVADEDAIGKPDAHEMVMATGVPKAATLFSSTASYAPSPPGSSTPNTLTVQPAPQQSPIPMTAATPVQPPQQQHQQQQQPQTVAMTTYLTSSSAATNGTSSSKAQSISMQLPTGGLTALIPQTASIPPGTPITISPMPQGQQGGSQQVFRVPAQSQFIQVPVSVPSSNTEPVQQTNSSATLQQPAQPTTQAAAPASGSAPVAPQGTIMYQTPQGVVYAAPSANTLGTIPEGYILNIPQAPAFTVSQEQQGNAPAQQYITIPVPVSLAGSTPILQPVIAHPAGDGGGDDKVRK